MNRFAILSCALIASTCFASDSIDIQAYNIAYFHPFRYRIHSLDVSPSLNFQVNNQKASGNGMSTSWNNDNANGSMDFYGSHFYRNFSVMSDLEVST